MGDKFKEEIDVLTLSTPIISCAAQATLALLYIMLRVTSLEQLNVAEFSGG